MRIWGKYLTLFRCPMEETKTKSTMALWSAHELVAQNVQIHSGHLLKNKVDDSFLQLNAIDICVYSLINSNIWLKFIDPFAIHVPYWHLMTLCVWPSVAGITINRTWPQVGRVGVVQLLGLSLKQNSGIQMGVSWNGAEWRWIIHFSRIFRSEPSILGGSPLEISACMMNHPDHQVNSCKFPASQAIQLCGIRSNRSSLSQGPGVSNRFCRWEQ